MKTLKTELEVVRNNISVMSDMMSQMEPASLEPSDIELLQVGIKYTSLLYFSACAHTSFSHDFRPINVKDCCCFSSLCRSVAALLHDQRYAGPDGGAHTQTERRAAYRAVTQCQ